MFSFCWFWCYCYCCCCCCCELATTKYVVFSIPFFPFLLVLLFCFFCIRSLQICTLCTSLRRNIKVLEAKQIYEKINNNANDKAYFMKIKCKSFSQGDKRTKKMFENENGKFAQQPYRLASIQILKHFFFQIELQTNK